MGSPTSSWKPVWDLCFEHIQAKFSMTVQRPILVWVDKCPKIGKVKGIRHFCCFACASWIKRLVIRKYFFHFLFTDKVDLTFQFMLSHNSCSTYKVALNTSGSILNCKQTYCFGIYPANRHCSISYWSILVCPTTSFLAVMIMWYTMLRWFHSILCVINWSQIESNN